MGDKVTLLHYLMYIFLTVLELSVFSSEVQFSNKRIGLWSIILGKILKDVQVVMDDFGSRT